MSEISKQALQVDNSQSFPDNNSGQISPSDLRAFNTNMIDSLVDEIGYNVDSASWNNSVSALNQFTSSQQPSFNALNSFTASQLTINTGVNQFTQSATGRLNNLEQYTASFTTSVGIFDESTFVNNVNQIAFSGNGISASFVSGKAVVSVNFTPLNQFTASTSQSLYQLQDNFNTFTQSTDNSIALIEQVTASYATTGSNTFTQNQYFEKNIAVTQSVYVGGNIYVDGGIEATYIKTIYETSSIIYSSGSNQLGDELLDTQILSGSTFIEGQLYVNKLNVTDQFAAINSFTASQLVVNSGYNTFTSSTLLDLDSIHQTTQSLNEYSQSNTARVDTLSSFTASYATTGSNNFKGIESIGDVAGTSTGEVYLLGRSGSLVLGNSISAQSYAGLSHYSSSQINANTNLIFKSNNTTQSLVISGSDNIISNPATAQAGTVRFIGSGGGNIMIGTNGTNIPQFSGSMAFPIVMNNNYVAGLLQARGPVSASLWTINQNNIQGNLLVGSNATLNAEKFVSVLTVNQNTVAGTLAVIGNQSFITSSIGISNNNINGTVTLQLSSSALTMNNNSINDSNFIFTNQFSSGAVGLGQPQMNVNTIGGALNTFFITGSQLGSGLSPALSQNIVLGNTNTLFVDASNARVSGSLIYHNAFANSILGNRLIVSGSSNNTDLNSYGSTFIGRFNANDGIRNKTSDVVFAVGTGISGSGTTGRKTGFLIDSGSNTFVEGSLNISGAIYNNVVSMSITAQTASLDMSLGSYFTLTLPASTSTRISISNQRPGQTAMLEITSNTFASASFSTNVKQPNGFAYQPTSISGAIDLLTLATFNSASVYVANVTNLA